jgi:predicted phosphoribosyltransferase
MKTEVEEMLQNRKEKGQKGRLPNDITNKQNLIKNKESEISLLRKGQRGVDPTIKNGKVKDWQIKSLSDKERKAIENIFSIAPAYQDKLYKFKGKNILLWDDNISSGATLDDICLTLQKIGVNEIIAMTLGTIPATMYDKKEMVRQQNSQLN